MSGPGPIRGRLRAAACLLLASSLPAAAHAETTASNQLDTSLLLYGEQGRTDVVEPTVRVSRVFANGHALGLSLGYDVITGASPTGAVPTGGVQTTTSASGVTTTSAAGTVPTKTFSDRRTALDMDWRAPITSVLASTLGGHWSKEKDYQSTGGSAKLALDALHHNITITAGGSVNHDQVFPVGGVPEGLTDGTGPRDPARQDKRVWSGLLGFSRVLSRRWLVSLNGTHGEESGYLTEPYKVVSVIDPTTMESAGELTEKRPASRSRNDVLATSVAQPGGDVLHLSYRYYWDDWKVTSHTIDLKLRHDFNERSWWQPHVRYYAQTSAWFYTTGLLQGAPAPDFASSDYRLGPLRTATIGATWGFHPGGSPGEWTVRAEYMRQTLKGPHGPDGGGEGGDGGFEAGTGKLAQTAAVAPTSAYDLALPPLHILSLVVGYSVKF